MRRREDDVAWERGWEGHQQKQLLASLPLAEKLSHLSDVARDSLRSKGRE